MVQTVYKEVSLHHPAHKKKKVLKKKHETPHVEHKQPAHKLVVLNWHWVVLAVGILAVLGVVIYAIYAGVHHGSSSGPGAGCLVIGPSGACSSCAFGYILNPQSQQCVVFLSSSDVASLSSCVANYNSALTPSCVISGASCAPPSWPPQWNLTLSTFTNVGNQPGYFLPSPDQPFGLIGLDWSTAKSIWQVDPNDATQDTCQATMVENCRQIKAISPATRCFVYKNMELGLEMLETDRAVMLNASTEHYFLQTTNNAGTYGEYVDGPGLEYYWDAREADASAYFANAVAYVLSSPYVDGTYLDDFQFPSEHPYAQAGTGLSQDQVNQVDFCQQILANVMLSELIANGKYIWQALGMPSANYDGPSPQVTQSGCTSFMAARCTTAWQSTVYAQTHDFGNPTQSVASFLIARGPYAFLGTGWEGGAAPWDPIYLLQVGEPTGNCAQTSSGVFSRPWTYGTVTLDCNAWTASIPNQGTTVTT